MNTITEVVKSQGSHILKNGEYNDCTVLALAASLEISYDDANQLAKKELKRQPKKGVPIKNLIQYFDNVESIKIGDISPKYVERMDVRNAYLYKKTGKVNYCKMNISTFVKKYPKGTYYMVVANHAFVIKDGEVLDHKHNLGKTKRIVKYAWKIK